MSHLLSALQIFLGKYHESFFILAVYELFKPKGCSSPVRAAEAALLIVARVTIQLPRRATILLCRHLAACTVKSFHTRNVTRPFQIV